MGDGAYLFDPQGDLRAWEIYPCLVACSDSLAGKVALTVQPRRGESISIANASGGPVDLGGHVLKLHNAGKPDQFVFGYPFKAGTVLAAVRDDGPRPGRLRQRRHAAAAPRRARRVRARRRPGRREPAHHRRPDDGVRGLGERVMPVSLREKLEAGGPAIGLWASIPSALTAEAAALAGPDYVVADQQHGALDPATLMAMLAAIAGAGAAPLVRVARNEPFAIGQALDLGAHGVIVPMVESGEEAARAVAACRYAPAGPLVRRAARRGGGAAAVPGDDRDPRRAGERGRDRRHAGARRDLRRPVGPRALARAPADDPARAPAGAGGARGGPRGLRGRRGDRRRALPGGGGRARAGRALRDGHRRRRHACCCRARSPRRCGWRAAAKAGRGGALRGVRAAWVRR